MSDRWLVVVAMALPLFLVAGDINGVTVALPAIGDDLDASTTSLQWLVNAYLLAFAALLLPMGRFGDLFGRRLIVIIGLAVFAGASLLSGLAQDEIVLVIGRALQGAGAAALFATSLSIVSGAFPPEERQKGIGIWSAIGVSGAAVGPLLGGILTEGPGWRWFFFVNVPIAAVALLMTLRVVPESRDPTASRHLDTAGFATATLGLLAVIYAIQQLDTTAIDSPGVLVPLLGGAALLAAFVATELRRTDPLIDLRLFGGRDFLSSGTVGMISQWLFFSTSFLATLYVQNVLDLDPLQAGLLFLALAVPFVGASLFNDWFTKRLGVKWGMTIGTTITGVGAAVLAFGGTERTAAVALVTLCYILLGVGLALSVNISTAGGMTAIDDDRAGAASGVLSSSRFVLAAFGVAVVGAIFKEVENADLGDAIVDAGAPESSRGEVEGLLSGSDAAVSRVDELAPGLGSAVEQAADDAFVTALGVAMAVNVVVAAIGVVLALLYRTPNGSEQTPPPPSVPSG